MMRMIFRTVRSVASVNTLIFCTVYLNWHLDYILSVLNVFLANYTIVLQRIFCSKLINCIPNSAVIIRRNGRLVSMCCNVILSACPQCL